MTEKYPFFREADEQTKTVIGEDAIAADLNGTYQKPYAVLTQKRLYCKNERGNFIVGADKLLGANMAQNAVAKNLLWAAFAVDMLYAVLVGILAYFFTKVRTVINTSFVAIVAIAICLVAFLLVRKKHPKISPLLLGIGSIFPIAYSLYLFMLGFFSIDVLIYALPSVAAVVLCVVAAIKNRDSGRFEVRHSTGTFTFSPKLYPAGELKNFEKQVKALQAGGANGR